MARTSNARDATLDLPRINGGDLERLMRETNTTMAELALVWGTRQRRVQLWLNDEERIPFAFHYLFDMLRDPTWKRSIIATCNSVLNDDNE